MDAILFIGSPEIPSQALLLTSHKESLWIKNYHLLIYVSHMRVIKNFAFNRTNSNQININMKDKRFEWKKK